MNRQAEDDLGDLLGCHELLKELRVGFPAAALVRGQWRGDAPIDVADGDADPHAAVVHAEQPAGAHRYFSRSVPFICSTSCLTSPSLRRSAISTASPSCTMMRSLTPAVVIR